MKDPGKIERKKNGTVIVTAKNVSDGLDDVICLNPKAKKEERIYQKTFLKKPIYFPNEYEKAIKEQIEHKDKFVISMNGYSTITDEQCLRYGIKKGAYEAACKATMMNVIKHLSSKFEGIDLKLIHGASWMGIDGVLQDVADNFNIKPLGFSCPRYMFYVYDNDIPVFVGKDENDYSDRYVQTVDFLICTGGREVALSHDVLAACKYNKRIHFIDVLNSLSTSGGVPATIVGKDGRTKIDNAAAAMGKNISFFTRENAVSHTPAKGDLWDAIFADVCSQVTQTCRYNMSPDRMF